MSLVDNLNVRRMHKRANDIRHERGLPLMVLDQSACEIAYETAIGGCIQTGKDCPNRCQLVLYSRDPNAPLLDCFNKWLSDHDDRMWFWTDEVFGCWVERSARGTCWVVRFGKLESVQERPKVGWWSSWWEFLRGR